MKVIHILNELKYSGAEIMYVAAADIFKDNSCELSVVGTADNLGEFSIQFEEAGYDVYHMPLPKKLYFFKRLLYCISFIRFLKKNKFDVLHCHSNKAYWIMALCAKIANIKSVYTFHSVFPKTSYSRIYHIVLRKIAKNIFKCKFQSISDSVQDNEKVNFKNHTFKINNWYNSNNFFQANLIEKMKIRRKLGISEDKFVIISIGGCSDIKRHSEIILALSKIVETVPNVLYLHLGHGDATHSEINLAKELNVSQHIRFEGNCDNVREYLIVSDIYLMTSKHEGISITTIEAMACGIPTILYDVPGLRDFNKFDNNSILIPADYNILANEIVNLSRTPTLGLNVSNNAINFVNANYSMKLNVQKIIELYRN